MSVIYNKKLKRFARELRLNSTPGEILLWSKLLKNRQMYGYRFNRQFPMQVSYENQTIDIIVDFICRKLKLIIEIDGYSHNFKFDKDKKRDYLLEKNGYTVLRFSEQEVKKDFDNVQRAIEQTVLELSKQSP